MSNGTIIAWDLCLPIPVARVCVINAHEGEITSLEYNEESNLVISAGLDHCIRVWDPIFSDLLDVSGVEKLKIEHEFKNDFFYCSHGGTVQPPILPSDTSMKKTYLVQ